MIGRPDVIRTLLPLLAAAALGAAGTYALLGGRATALPPGLAAGDALRREDDTASPLPAARGAGDAPLPVSQRSVLYRLAADADAPELRGLLEEAAALAPSPGRRMALEALLVRYTEIDPPAAVRQAQRLDADTAVLAQMFQVWAAADAGAALRGLEGLEDRNAAREVGLALVDLLGSDEAAAARLMAALPDADPADLQAALLARTARTAPEDALRRALGLADPVAVRAALRRVAEAWGRTDPEAALAQLASIPDSSHRAMFQEGVLRQWALVDAEAAFEHVLSAPRPDARALPGLPAFRFGPQASGGSFIVDLAYREPMRVLEAADRLPPPYNQIAPQVALRALAEQDPLRAIRYAEAAPAGQMRQMQLQMAARAYGRSDPRAALEWARGTAPGDSSLRAAVVGGIAETDPDYALDIAFGEPDRMLRMQVVHSAITSLGANAGDLRRFADRILDEDESGPTSMLQVMASVWSSVDPRGAVEWLVDNSERVDASGFAGAARQLAAHDPALAASYMQRVPERVRPDWIGAVASAYAESEPEQAIRLIEQIRGEPAFEQAATSIVQRVAQHDPAAAANLLDDFARGSSSPAWFGMTQLVASQWAASDPFAAAQWAQNLEPPVRPGAVQQVVSTWAVRDGAAARSWVLSMPGSPERDRSLAALLNTLSAANAGDVDAALMSAFSSDEAAQQGLLPVVIRAMQQDPDRGRQLLDAWITDPNLRAQAEQSSGRGGPNALSFGSGPRGPMVVPGGGMILRDANGALVVR